MSSDIKKQKPTLESLIQDNQVLTGKKLIQQKIERESEAKKEKELFEDAIEFEMRNRKIRALRKS